MYVFIGANGVSYSKSELYTYIYGLNATDYPTDGMYEYGDGSKV